MSTSRNKTLLLRNVMHVFLTFMLILPALYLRAPTMAHAEIHLAPEVGILTDSRDAIPGNNICADGDGNCSLRAAIEEINFQGGAGHTITFQDGLTGTIQLSDSFGELSITTDMTITGLGSNNTIVLAANGERVFHVESGYTVEIAEMTIKGGRMQYGNGGGILNAGTLTIKDCLITDNQALGDPGLVSTDSGFGGGIYNLGTLNVTDSTISNNTAQGGDGADGQLNGGNGGGGGGAGLGGGIYNNGTVELTNSTISGNQSIGGNGGNGTASGTALIANGGNGGGAGGAGGIGDGAVGQDGVTLGGGGGGGAKGGAGVIGGDGAEGGGAGGGGGLGFGGGTGGNGQHGGGDGGDATTDGGGSGGGGGGGGGLGGGIYNQSSSTQVTINHSTIANNSATGGNPGLGGSGSEAGESIGGGVYNYLGVAISIQNSVVFGNAADSGKQDCGSIAPLTSLGNNLIGSGTGCPSTGSDIIVADAKLGLLADNGGNTDTHALLPGSRAVNAGLSPCVVSADQRGVSRPQGLVCDIGAYEATADLTVSISVDNPNPDLGEQVTYTIVITNSGALTATQVVITDFVPAGLTFVPASVTIEPAGAGTTGNPPTLVSGLTISAGLSVTSTFALVVNYGLPNGTVIENTVEVGGAEETASGKDVLSITVKAPVLVVSKTATPDNPPVGTQVVYEIVVENQGLKDATNVVISDTLHELLIPGPYEQEGGGGVVTYTNGSLFASGLTITQGESITFSLPVTVSYGPGEGTHRIDVPDGTLIPNTVQVSSTEVITALTFTENITVSAPTLGVVKDVSDLTPWKGKTITYTIVVENSGSIAATNVTILDDIPDELTFVEGSVRPEGNIGTVVLPGGGVRLMASQMTIAPQKSVTLTFEAVVNDVDDGTVVTNTAHVTSTEVAAYQDGVKVITVRYPILSLTKTPDDLEPALNRSFKYVIVVTNDGSVDATNAVISDTLSAGLLFAGPVTIYPPQPGAVVAQETGDLPDLVTNLTIAAFGSVTVTFPVTVSTSPTIGAKIANTASVSSDEVSSSVENPSGSAVVEIMGTELILTKTASDPSPNPGDYITYTIVVENAGDIDAHNAVISDTLAPTLEFKDSVTVEPQPPQGTYTVTWSANDLTMLVSGLTILQGEKITVTFVVRVNEHLYDGALIYNTATITATEVPAPQGNSDDPTEIIIEDTESPIFFQGPPTLLSPFNGEITSTLRPLFSWYSAIDNGVVMSYALVITGDANYDFTVTATPDITVTTFVPPDMAQGVYSWTITAYDSAGNSSAPVDPFVFTIRVGTDWLIYLPFVCKQYP